MSDPSSFSRNRSPETISVRAPDGWAWLAGVAILVMAAYGLYRGVTGVQNGQAGLLLAPHAGGIVAPVDAAPAAPLVNTGQWSTLSGPQALQPPAPAPVKVAKTAPSDDSADDQSDNPPDKAASPDTDAANPDDAPPPPKSKPKPAKAAPVPDEDAPAANSPDAPL